MNPDHKEFLTVLGHCFLQHGRFHDAGTVFEALVVLFPDEIAPKASLAYARLRLGDYGAALAQTDGLLRQPLPSRDRSFALSLRARALWGLARTDEARLVTDQLRALPVDPS